MGALKETEMKTEYRAFRDAIYDQFARIGKEL